MPSLQVREVPTALYGSLCEASKQEHRSLAQQTIVTLERGLGFEEDPVQRRGRLIRQISEQTRAELPQLPDPVDLVREDRER